MNRRHFLLATAVSAIASKAFAQDGKNVVPVLAAPEKYNGPRRQDPKAMKPVSALDAQSKAVVAEALAGPLQVRYGVPKTEGFNFLTEQELDALKLTREQLRLTALNNWKAAYPEQAPRDLGGGLWLVERTLASTLMLVPSSWEQWKGKVSGALTLVAPALDVVAFTGGGSRSNMRALGSITQQAKRMSYASQLTPSMFRWEQGAWELWQ